MRVRFVTQTSSPFSAERHEMNLIEQANFYVHPNNVVRTSFAASHAENADLVFISRITSSSSADSNFNVDIPMMGFAPSIAEECWEFGGTRSSVLGVRELRVIDDTHPAIQAIGWSTNDVIDTGDGQTAHYFQNITSGTAYLARDGDTSQLLLIENEVNGEKKVYVGVGSWGVWPYGEPLAFIVHVLESFGEGFNFTVAEYPEIELIYGQPVAAASIEGGVMHLNGVPIEGNFLIENIHTILSGGWQHVELKFAPSNTDIPASPVFPAPVFVHTEEAVFEVEIIDTGHATEGASEIGVVYGKQSMPNRGNVFPSGYGYGNVTRKAGPFAVGTHEVATAHLDYETTYYARVYVSSDAGFVYSDEFTFTTGESPAPPKPLNAVVFNVRKGAVSNYDQALMDFMEELGYNIVFAVSDVDLQFADLDDADLLVIGAPDTDWFASHESGDTIANSPIPVLSFCRGASRMYREIGTGSSSTTINSFTLVDSDHEIPQTIEWTSGTLTLGSFAASHRVSSLHSETITVAHDGTSGALGLGYRELNNVIGLHFGYYMVDLMTQNGLDLLEATLKYLHPIEEITQVDVTVSATTAHVSAESYAPTTTIEVVESIAVEVPVQEAQVEGFMPNVLTTANITILAQPPPASAEALTPQIIATKNVTVSSAIGEVAADTLKSSINVTTNIVISGVLQNVNASGLSAEVETTRHIAVSVPITNVSAAGHEAAIGLTGNIDVFAPSSNAIGESFIPDAELTRNIAVANGVGVADAQSIIPGIEFTKNVEINATVANLITDTMLVSIETEIPDFALTATQDLHNIVLTWEVGE